MMQLKRVQNIIPPTRDTCRAFWIIFKAKKMNFSPPNVNTD